MRRQGGFAAQAALQIAGLIQTITQSRQIARPATAERQARQGAGQIRHLAQHLAQIVTQPFAIQQIGHGIKAMINRRRIGERRLQAHGQQACPGAGQGQINGGEQRAIAAAGQGFDQFQIAPRGGINRHQAGGCLAQRRAQAGQFAALGQFNIIQQGARCRAFRTCEGAEGIQCCNAEGGFEPAFAIAGIKARPGQRRQRHLDAIQRSPQGRLRQQAIRQQQFTRAQPRQIGPQAGGIRFS